MDSVKFQKIYCKFKTISSITYEIIRTNKFKQAFINQKLSLNKKFNSSIFLK